MPRNHLSLDAAHHVGLDPHEGDAENVRWSTPLATLAARCSDPLFAPTVDELPLPHLDVEALVDRLERHYGSDVCAPQQLLLLAERVSRRNQNILATVVHKFQANGVSLEQFLHAANDVVDAFQSRANDGAIDTTLGAYLVLARRAGLTPTEACEFGRFPTDLAQRVRGGSTATIYGALEGDPHSSYRTIADRLGVGATTVRRVVEAWGDPHVDVRFRADLYSRIRELRTEGLSYAAIALQVGCSKSTVNAALVGSVTA